MKEENEILQLLSEESALPNSKFVANLEKRLIKKEKKIMKSISTSSNFKLQYAALSFPVFIALAALPFVLAGTDEGVDQDQTLIMEDELDNKIDTTINSFDKCAEAENTVISEGGKKCTTEDGLTFISEKETLKSEPGQQITQEDSLSALAEKQSHIASEDTEDIEEPSDSNPTHEPDESNQLFHNWSNQAQPIDF